MLSVQNLSKKINNQPILQDVSFELHAGSITALLGRNGAGKTTLLRTIIGILDPDSGTVTYEGKSIFEFPHVKENIVFIPDSHSLFKNYSVKEMISLYRRIYPRFNERKFIDLLQRFHIPGQGTLRRFSKGMRAMFFIALSFSTQAELIILDEPTNGLDPIVKRQMLQFVIEEVSENQVALLLSTHHLAEVEAMADTVLFMKDGSIAIQASLEDMRQNMKKVQIAFQDKPITKVTNLKGVRLLQQSGRVLTLLITEEPQIAIEILEEMEPILLEELPISLEDIFVHTLGGDPHVV